nr:translation initiation factor IF-2 [Anaerolineae bacterium]
MPDTTGGKNLEIPDFLTVRELAELMVDASPIDVIKELMRNGIMAAINQQIDYETAAIVAAEMGYEPSPAAREVEEVVTPEEAQAWRRFHSSESPELLVDRPPVVAVLGHVDHGKTSLLDKIRETNVQSGEAGGITQHIGAYQVVHEGRTITFLDTPGHQAFTAMRARGAQGADIAILVVAADDGVMPQTREAINHARAAGVPILVALNKTDRTQARPEQVKQQLADLDLVSDEWDGDTIIVPVSAITGVGLEDLLEAIILMADDMFIKANPQGHVGGTVLEGELDRSRGAMATLLIQNGTLRQGDTILAGTSYGRIKAMFNEHGKPIKEAAPSMPVQVMGLNEVPEAGTLFEIVENEKTARGLVEERLESMVVARPRSAPMTLEDLYARFQAGEAKELNLIVKADVQGSLEPIVTSLEELSIPEKGKELTVNILHTDIGNINESDVMLASASDAIVVGFQVDIDTAAQRRADSEGIDIRLYDIIYHLIDDVEQALEGLLEPVYEDKVIGRAEVRQVFHIPKLGPIAGSYMQEGEARRDASARVIRDGEIIHSGKVTSLKRFQEDVREVRAGFEFGVNVSGFTDFIDGDIIEFTKSERVR